MTTLLLDAFNLLYRSFLTLPPSIKDAQGQPINAVYGMVAAILRLMRQVETEHIMAAFDVPDVPTFRQRLYPPYQQQRGPLGGDQSAEFLRQVDLAFRTLPALGIGTVRRPGFEADDIVGTAARRLSAQGRTCLIVSTDRDLLQLIDGNVAVLAPGSDEPIATVEGVIDRMGVPPEGVTTLKALAGDPSDNIPGLPGIGAKIGANLVTAHGTLERIYASLPVLTPRIRHILEVHRDDAFLFRQVVTIVTDLPIAPELDALQIPALSAEERVRSVLERAGIPALSRGAGTPGGIRTPDL